jgi:hypothetical protein
VEDREDQPADHEDGEYEILEDQFEVHGLPSPAETPPGGRRSGLYHRSMARINRNKNPETHEKGCDPISFDRFSRRKRFISLGHSSALPVPGGGDLATSTCFCDKMLLLQRTAGLEFLRDDRRDP